MKRLFLTLALAILASCATTDPNGGRTTPQGWTESERNQFYTGDQGSRIMKTSWMVALKQPDGQPFLGDRLNRYGYLSNELDQTSILPIGFTTNGVGPNQAIGMTCSACHTREIQVNNTRHRIDGGPAIVDFESFLIDLNAAVGTVVAQPAAFDAFALSVLGAGGTQDQKATLLADVTIWHTRFNTLITRSLPTPLWGPGRLDAVSMIFNRLTGLDIGPKGPNDMIPENIRAADAPVRYPFLWNASRQDKTQWPGFADNGDGILALARNVGEVYGVFAEFHPFRDKKKLLNVNYIANNSANFDGLMKLERLIEKLNPPKFPWPVDTALAAQGQAIYGTGPTAQGSCWGCHGIMPGADRFLESKPTWKTQIIDVGSDTRQYDVLATKVKTGSLSGAGVPFLIPALKPEDTAFNTLRMAVVGGILQKLFDFRTGSRDAAAAPPVATLEQTTIQAPAVATTQQRVLAGSETAKTLLGAYQTPTVTAAYESRVMQGIWAAAPYLHNGSVPTLADLLKPAAQRPASFKIGPEYDPVNVGLAVNQTRFNQVLRTTDCADRNSGNSRCGHEYGIELTAQQKRALLEYLKTL